MRIVTGLAGVLALAAVTVSGATLEELKTQYNEDPTGDNAVAVMEKMAENDNKADAVNFGKTAYAETEAVDVVKQTIAYMSDRGNPENVVAFADTVYNTDPMDLIEPRGMIGASFNDAGRTEDEVQFWKKAYQDTQEGVLVQRVCISLARLERYQEAMDYAADAMMDTPHRKIVQMMVTLHTDHGANLPGPDNYTSWAEVLKIGVHGEVSYLGNVILDDDVDATVKQNIASQLVDEWVSRIITKGDITPKEFRSQLDMAKTFMNMLDKSQRGQYWSNLADAMPLNSEYAISDNDDDKNNDWSREMTVVQYKAERYSQYSQ